MNKYVSIFKAALLTTSIVLVAQASSSQTTGWSQCAVEGGTCSFSGSRTIRYGADPKYVTKTLSGSVSCSNATFGDPYYGANKHCDLYTATAAAAPDLVVSSISLSPAVPVVGTAVTFSVVVKNTGTAATKAGTTLGVGFSVDGQKVSWSDTYSAALAAGASVTLTANNGPNKVPTWSATSGNHTVMAFVDDALRIAESNETNNQLSRAFSVGGTVTPAATPTPTPAPPPPVPSTSASGKVGPLITTFTASGPITLVSGQTVTGLAISNPNGPCILGNGVSNVHIYNNKIGPCGPGTQDGAVQIAGGHDILVEHNAIDNVVAGFFANSSTNNLVFDHNYVTRIKNAFPRAQMVQIAQSTGSGIRITCNVSDQPTPGYLGGPEDQINLYKTFGTAASPILIKNNKFRGGGPSNSGGGILAGDESSSYITIDSNILVSPGQYGIGIAGGHNNRVLNNKVYSASYAWVNVGIYVWNQYAATCAANEVSGNRVNWTDRNGRQNPWENNGNCGAVTQNGNVFADMTITPSIWDEVFPDCN